MIYHPFKSGDYVDAGGIQGTVQRIELFTTILKNTGQQARYRSKLAHYGVAKYQFLGIRTNASCRLGHWASYKADLKKTKEVLMNVITSDERVLQGPCHHALRSLLLATHRST